MAKQNINIGTAPNSGTGDPLRSAFTKINENFTELYNRSVFSGSYNDLTNKPVIFNGDYNNLTNKPIIPTDVNQLTDTGGLLSSGGTSYNQSLNTTDDVTFNSITLATANIAELEEIYLEKVTLLNDYFAVGIDGTTPYTGPGSPASKSSYEALIRAKSINPLIPDAWLPAANSLTNAYYTWAAASVTITPSESGVTIENGGGVGYRYDEATGLRFPDNTFQTTAYTGSELGDLKISFNTIGTTDGQGGWGGHDLYLSPNGESYAWIHIPNDANTQSGSPLIVGNGNNSGTGVHIRASGSGWEFKPNAVLQLPAGGDIVNSNGQSVLGASGPNIKTHTFTDNSVWRIEEAHGAAKFDYNYITLTDTVIAQATVSLENVNFVDINNDDYPGFYSASSIQSITINGQTFNFTGNEWLGGGTTYRYFIDGVVSYNAGDLIMGNIVIGQNPPEPTKWWDAADLPNGDADFRGAIIDYHAYSPDCGTMIGTIKIARDSGDNTVTHSEVASGGNDTAHIKFWGRNGNEGQLFFYRTDDEDDQNVKIHWTAKVFYGPDFWD